MGKLVTLEFETSLKAVYKFPDIDEEELGSFLQGKFSVGEKLHLVNVSSAYLELPWRIVDVVRVDGVERWRRG
jgi:hypothetical protein